MMARIDSSEPTNSILSDINAFNTRKIHPSHSLGPNYQIRVDYNNPENFNFNVEKNQVLSINSTIPYLSVIFTLLPLCNIRVYKSSKRLSSLKEYQTIEIGNDFAGFDFGCDIGHLELYFIDNGQVQFSLFAFPKTCGDRRLIMHIPYHKFVMSSIISQTNFFNNNNTLCIFPDGGDPLINTHINLNPSLYMKKYANDICERIRTQNVSISNSYLVLESSSPFYSYYYSFDFQQKNFRGSFGSIKLITTKSLSVIHKQSILTPTPLPVYKSNQDNSNINFIYALLGILLFAVPLVVIALITKKESTVDEGQNVPLLIKSESNHSQKTARYKKEKADLPKVNFETFLEK